MKTHRHRHTHLLIDLLELGLQHYHALSRIGIPNLRQVVDSLGPLVHQKRGRLRVARLFAAITQIAFSCFSEQETRSRASHTKGAHAIETHDEQRQGTGKWCGYRLDRYRTVWTTIQQTSTFWWEVWGMTIMYKPQRKTVHAGIFLNCLGTLYSPKHRCRSTSESCWK